MLVLATTSIPEAVLPPRVLYREEMYGQIVHDSIHRREGWTVTYMLNVDGVTTDFGAVFVRYWVLAVPKSPTGAFSLRSRLA